MTQGKLPNHSALLIEKVGIINASALWALGEDQANFIVVSLSCGHYDFWDSIYIWPFLARPVGHRHINHETDKAMPPVGGEGGL